MTTKTEAEIRDELRKLGVNSAKFGAAHAFGLKHFAFVAAELDAFIEAGARPGEAGQLIAFELLDTAFNLLGAMGVPYGEVTKAVELVRKRAEINDLCSRGTISEDERKAMLIDSVAPVLAKMRRKQA